MASGENRLRTRKSRYRGIRSFFTRSRGLLMKTGTEWGRMDHCVRNAWVASQALGFYAHVAASFQPELDNLIDD